MSKENVILIDYDAPDDWEFHKAIEKTTGTKWTVYKAVSNENHGGILQKLIRYAKYFLTPMKIAKNRNNYGKVLAWQQFYGLILAFYFRLMHVKESPEIVVLTFIYKPKKSLIGKIYDKFMRYIVTSGYIKYFVVFSESEKRRYADYFDIPESQFIFETLGYEDKTKDVPRLGSEDFYLAAGRSNRDYKFLTEAWSKRKEKLEIICDTLNLKSAIENMINREYTDDTLKNLQVIPISFPKLMIGKLTTIGLLSILLGLCNSFVTIIVGIIACRENMTLSTIIIGTIQICGMALFTFIGEMPLIAHCGKKQNSFKGGAVAAFLLGYISIYFKNPIIRNLYPLSAGLSIVGFNGEGFVTDTTGAYSSSQSILLGVLTMLAMLILSLIIISIPQKETLATPLSQKRRKTERKIAK